MGKGLSLSGDKHATSLLVRRQGAEAAAPAWSVMADKQRDEKPSSGFQPKQGDLYSLPPSEIAIGST